jgi:hypothetical protein
MRGLGEVETPTESLFNNLNQVIRVGACLSGDDRKIISQSKLLCEFIEFICTAEPSLGFSQNPISILTEEFDHGSD